MAKLSYAKRKKLPNKDFAVIETRKKKRGKGKVVDKRFPMPDKAHARNALARLPQAEGLSASDKEKIKKKAHDILYGTNSESKIDAMKAKRRKADKNHELAKKMRTRLKRR